MAEPLLHQKDIPAGHDPGRICRRIFQDSYPNKGWVLIHGKKAPILGRVCMDQFMVDVTEIPEVKAGDEVTLIGKDGRRDLSVWRHLEICPDAFLMNLLCEISKRVPRVYIKDGKECGERNFLQ